MVSERNDPALHRIGRAKELMRDLIYRRARLVVVQTQRVALYFQETLSPKLRIIANPVPLAAGIAKPDRPTEAGRLELLRSDASPLIKASAV